ncbi:CDP-alcohol phosphatidyltransferase family protein [Mesorhizobium sp.]|uniref:CDP-alcohol phosphatidyltransferase family protein n=1 Tax=Mesorhizobium sp. TaxID=1871066 RepID=UPI000FE5A177|nr:CDP-alcohol phosphatidyltransferase family protein [Mesorhizobium sp.]RWM19441.1 MAG: CDP-alcohol phosphatidyltransferase family protein [Mesorhizobium sp.]RWM31228.1 MAG: CDP-alcohol phosphatidyltransferase family protein [Mesorhizobium sp.]TIO72985.1 MAG: CDP-alcohol phosphatidyltransferase family protein [Mesorhizobium sp.]TIO80969.1 MAG: CDP-alcohol phosphatidyltransferase family protein [Mesorhizobium sp.]TJV47976.1 MAG: CDP-alcohol phosphatidyltransferase family protein [Mesorhizobium
MFDRKLQPLQKRVLTPLAAWLARRGVSADTVTLLGFAVGLAAVPLLASGYYIAALVVILANRALDGLDGALARQTQATDRGAFLDIALDFVFYALVPFGFALADPAANALSAAALLLAFIGTGTSFLAFAAVAGRLGLSSVSYPTKGIYYLGGLTEGAETIAVFVAMCLWPTAFPFLAFGFAGLCALTTVTRWRWGWRAFGASSSSFARAQASTAIKIKKLETEGEPTS